MTATPPREQTVLVNGEGQYAVFPADLPVPPGWLAAGFRGSLEECQDHVDLRWSDLRPRSLQCATGAVGVPAPQFSVIPGDLVHEVLSGDEVGVTALVETAYRLHAAGETAIADSCFLRFPDRPRSRIIALPASVRGHVGVDGVKWVSSVPDNVTRGLPRASAVIVINDPLTGYPLACLEGSIISAARTAASAALAAVRLSRARGVTPRRVGFVGTGLIARYVHTYLAANGLRFERFGVHDLVPEHAVRFADYLSRHEDGVIDDHGDPEGLILESDLVVFATVAASPYLHDAATFAHNPLVLHLSLRDLGPEVILASYNLADDVDHCLTASTSLHLAEQVTGDRGFVAGTLDDVLRQRLVPPADRPVVFSPFGLGVLDLVVGKHVYDTLTAAGRLRPVPGFFLDLDRHSAPQTHPAPARTGS